MRIELWEKVLSTLLLIANISFNYSFCQSSMLAAPGASTTVEFTEEELKMARFRSWARESKVELEKLSKTWEAVINSPVKGRADKQKNREECFDNAREIAIVALKKMDELRHLNLIENEEDLVLHYLKRNFGGAKQIDHIINDSPFKSDVLSYTSEAIKRKIQVKRMGLEINKLIKYFNEFAQFTKLVPIETNSAYIDFEKSKKVLINGRSVREIDAAL